MRAGRRTPAGPPVEFLLAGSRRWERRLSVASATAGILAACVALAVDLARPVSEPVVVRLESSAHPGSRPRPRRLPRNFEEVHELSEVELGPGRLEEALRPSQAALDALPELTRKDFR